MNPIPSNTGLTREASSPNENATDNFTTLGTVNSHSNSKGTSVENHGTSNNTNNINNSQNTSTLPITPVCAPAFSTLPNTLQLLQQQPVTQLQPVSQFGQFQPYLQQQPQQQQHQQQSQPSHGMMPTLSTPMGSQSYGSMQMPPLGFNGPTQQQLPQSFSNHQSQQPQQQQQQSSTQSYIQPLSSPDTMSHLPHQSAFPPPPPSSSTNFSNHQQHQQQQQQQQQQQFQHPSQPESLNHLISPLLQSIQSPHTPINPDHAAFQSLTTHSLQHLQPLSNHPNQSHHHQQQQPQQQSLQYTQPNHQQQQPLQVLGLPLGLLPHSHQHHSNQSNQQQQHRQHDHLVMTGLFGMPHTTSGGANSLNGIVPTTSSIMNTQSISLGLTSAPGSVVSASHSAPLNSLTILSLVDNNNNNGVGHNHSNSSGTHSSSNITTAKTSANTSPLATSVHSTPTSPNGVEKDQQGQQGLNSSPEEKIKKTSTPPSPHQQGFTSSPHQQKQLQQHQQQTTLTNESLLQRELNVANRELQQNEREQQLVAREYQLGLLEQSLIIQQQQIKIEMGQLEFAKHELTEQKQQFFKQYQQQYQLPQHLQQQLHQQQQQEHDLQVHPASGNSLHHFRNPSQSHGQILNSVSSQQQQQQQQLGMGNRIGPVNSLGSTTLQLVNNPSSTMSQINSNSSTVPFYPTSDTISLLHLSNNVHSNNYPSQQKQSHHSHHHHHHQGPFSNGSASHFNTSTNTDPSNNHHNNINIHHPDGMISNSIISPINPMIQNNLLLGTASNGTQHFSNTHSQLSFAHPQDGSPYLYQPLIPIQPSLLNETDRVSFSHKGRPPPALGIMKQRTEDFLKKRNDKMNPTASGLAVIQILPLHRKIILHLAPLHQQPSDRTLAQQLWDTDGHLSIKYGVKNLDISNDKLSPIPQLTPELKIFLSIRGTGQHTDWIQINGPGSFHLDLLKFNHFSDTWSPQGQLRTKPRNNDQCGCANPGGEFCNFKTSSLPLLELAHRNGSVSINTFRGCIQLIWFQPGEKGYDNLEDYFYK